MVCRGRMWHFVLLCGFIVHSTSQEVASNEPPEQEWFEEDSGVGLRKLKGTGQKPGCPPLRSGLLMRAMKYDPRPLYAQLGLDTYVQSYSQFHERDLKLMQKIEMPNAPEKEKIKTILLNAWEPGASHSLFLKKCKEHDMKVIPAFNISSYWQNSLCGDELCPGVRKQLDQDFTIFLHQASDEPTDEQGKNLSHWTVHEAVEMWNIVGLPELPQLLRTEGCVEPDLSAKIAPMKSCARPGGDSDTWQLGTILVLQEILATIRLAQQKFLCESEEGTDLAEERKPKDKPCIKQGETFRKILLTLAVGKEMNLYLNTTRNYVAQTIFWMERVIGCNHLTKQVQIPISESEVNATCADEGKGFFDAINLQITTSSDKLAVQGLHAFLEDSFSPSVSAERLPVDSASEPKVRVKNGKDLSLAELAFKDLGGPMKPTLLEYGFADVDLEDNEEDIKYHQQLLGEFEARYTELSKEKDFCLSGTIIDEWMGHENKDEVRGVVSQFDTNILHCIDPPPWASASLSRGDKKTHMCVSIDWTSTMVWIVIGTGCLMIIREPIKSVSKRANKVRKMIAGFFNKTHKAQPSRPLSRKALVKQIEFMKQNVATKEKFKGLSGDSYGYALAVRVAAKLKGAAPLEIAEECKKNSELETRASLANVSLASTAEARETFPTAADLHLIVGYAGWGLRYVGNDQGCCGGSKNKKSRFEYCRVKEGGSGFVAPDEDESEKVQDTSDQTSSGGDHVEGNGNSPEREEPAPLFWESDAEFVDWLANMSDEEFAIYGFKEEDLNNSKFVANRTINMSALQLLTTRKDANDVLVTEHLWNKSDSLLRPDDVLSRPRTEHFSQMGYCRFDITVNLKADDFFLGNATTKEKLQIPADIFFDEKTSDPKEDALVVDELRKRIEERGWTNGDNISVRSSNKTRGKTFRFNWEGHSVLEMLSEPPEQEDFPLKLSKIQDKKQEIKNFMQVFMRSHLRAQARRLEEQIYHEKQFIMTALIGERVKDEWEKEAADKAMKVIWKKVLEGCLVCKEFIKGAQDNWRDDPDDPGTTISKTELTDDDDFQTLFVQALLMRFLESAGEHIMHCPEYLSWVYFKTLESLKMKKGDTKAAEENVWYVTIDFNHLVDPIEEFSRHMNVYNGSSQGISLDDINDAGAEALATGKGVLEDKETGVVSIPMKKQWNEPIGYRVVVNVLSNHGKVFRLLYLLALAAFAFGDYSCKHGYTGEMQTALCTIHLNYNLGSMYTPITPFFVMTVDSAIYLILSFCDLLVEAPWTINKTRLLGRCALFRKLVFSIGLLLLFSLCLASYGVGEALLGDSLDDIRVYIAWGYFGFCALQIILSSLLASRSSNVSFLPGRRPPKKDKPQDGEQVQDLPSSQEEDKAGSVLSMNYRGIFMTIVILILNLILYVQMLYPLARPVDPWTLCSDVCQLNTAKVAHDFCLGSVPPFDKFPFCTDKNFMPASSLNEATCGLLNDLDPKESCHYSTQCLACLSVFAHVWILLSFGIVVTLFFVYYGMVGIVGGFIGFSRGLASTEMKALTFREAPQVRSLSDNRLQKAEARDISEGGTMQRVFGLKWKEMWKLTVEALHRESLLDDKTKDQFIEAAEKNKDVNLRCPNGSLQEIARHRLDFLFKTFRQILSEDTFQPYYESLKEDDWKKLHEDHGSKSRREEGTGMQDCCDALGEVCRHHAQGKLPSLTQIIPVYGEMGLYTMKELLGRENDDRRLPTLLEFIISQFKEEWEIFSANLGCNPRELYEVVTSRSLPDGDVLQTKLLEWASHRHQTVYRTVDGAVNYHKAVQVLLKWPGSKNAPSRSDMVPHVQLLLSHQTYGRGSKIDRREKDVHFMLRQFKDYPVYLIIDYDESSKGSCLPQLTKLVRKHLKDQFGYEPLSRTIRYASLLAEFDPDAPRDSEFPIRLVRVLPRIRPLRLKDGGGSGLQTQGKAANQLQAMRFATGHYLQMMDANMGCFFGETLKVPHVLRDFRAKPKFIESADQGKRFVVSSDVTMRVIGFREHVYTRTHGLMGKITADAEWTFGTATQRFLQFMGVRMHYGHPDFVDSFWAGNRGSVSKASPINLSEDIFFGFNVNMRNELSEHTDILEWEKGREVQFLGAAGLFWKFSSGNVGVMRSRDLKVLCMSASHLYSVPLYFATVAWYVHQVLVDISTEIYLQLFILLALASKSIEDLGELGSVLAVEWVVSPGLSALLPGLMTFGIEYGISRLLFDYCPSVLSSSMAFTFINKSVSVAMRQTVSDNIAEYVNTGRPHANKSYSLKEAFLAFRTSHYNPAITMVSYFVVYTLASQRLASGSAMPMFIINAMGVVWIQAPVLFQPPGPDSRTQQLLELFDYIKESPRSGFPADKKHTLYDAVMLEEFQTARNRPFMDFLGSLVPSALYFFCLPAIAFDQMFLIVIALAVNFAMEFFWPMKQAKPTFVFILIKGSMVVVLLLSPFIDKIFDYRLIGLSLLALYHFVKSAKLLFLSALRQYWNIKCNFLSGGDSVDFDRYVIRISNSFCVMPIHRVGALIVLLFQAAFSIFISIIEDFRIPLYWFQIGPLRLHTWYLFGWDYKPENVKTMYPPGENQDLSPDETLERLKEKFAPKVRFEDMAAVNRDVVQCRKCLKMFDAEEDTCPYCAKIDARIIEDAPTTDSIPRDEGTGIERMTSGGPRNGVSGDHREAEEGATSVQPNTEPAGTSTQ